MCFFNNKRLILYLYYLIVFFRNIVDGLEVNSITKGLCLLVGLQKTDEKNDIDAM